MKFVIEARRSLRCLTALALLIFAIPLAAFAQQPSKRVVPPLEPRPSDGATAAYGILGRETESLFARIPKAPPHAGEYLTLHGVASSPTNAAWSNALARLSVVGDDFTIRMLEAVKRPDASSETLRLASQAIERINTKLTREGINPPTAVLIARLERAALADIVCHPLETSLVPWALASVRPQVKRPEVKTALEKLAAYQVPPVQQFTLDLAYQARLARYANQLLERQQ
jgi:hypothetical protein